MKDNFCPISKNLNHLASSGMADQLLEALDLGADPTTRFQGVDALMMACTNGHPACVELLVSLCDPLASDYAGNTALHRAAGYGHAGCVQALLAHPKASRARSILNQEARTPYLVAAHRGDPDCVRALFEASDLSALDRRGQNALMAACSNGSHEVVSMLLPLYPSGDLDEQGHSALMIAAAHAYPLCVELLIPASNIHLADKEGRDALILLAAESKPQWISGSSSWAQSAWQSAEDNQVETCNILLASGADPFARTHAGNFALGLATANGHIPLARAIFEGMSLCSPDRALATLIEATSRTKGELESYFKEWALSAEEKLSLGIVASQASTVKSQFQSL